MLALPVSCKAQVTNLRYQLRARRRLQTYATNCAPPVARRRLQTYATNCASDAGYKPTLPVVC